MNELNLIPAIREIEAQIRTMEIAHKAKIEPYKESLEHLRKINTACEQCDGSGEVFIRACAEDDGHIIPCNACGGTGLVRRRE